MAGGDAFFEEGIHWLHLAGSLGPRSSRIDGYRPAAVARGPGHARQEHDGGVPVRQRRRRLALLLARDSVALPRAAASRSCSAGRASSPSSRTAVRLRARGGLPRLLFPGFRDIRGYQAMYRDFVGAIRDRRAPEMSLERAIDDQRLMDQIYASVGNSGSEPHTSTSSSSAPARAAARWRTRCRRRGARILILERGDFVPQEDENWDPGRGLEGAPLPRRRSAGSTSAGANSRRTRTTASAATRSSGAACSIACGARTSRRSSTPTASRRRGRSTTRRSRRTTSAPSALYHVRGEAGDRSDRAAARPVSRTRRCRTRPGWRRSSSSCARRACIRRRCRSGCCDPGEDGRLHPLQHVQLVRLQAAREERRRRLLRPAGARSGRTSRCGPTRTRERLITDRVGPTSRGRRGRARRRDGSRRRAARRSSSCGAVNSAALLLRSATDKHPERPRELVGPRRHALHGAPRDDDAGVPSVPAELDRVSEDGGDQRLLPARAAHAVPARTDPVAGAHARRHGADRRARGFRCGPYDAWVARGVDWLAMSEDLPRLDNRVTRRAATAASACTYRPNNVTRAQRAGRRNEAHPAAARLLGRDDALARQHEHDAPVRHAVLRHRSAQRRCSIRSAARTTSRTCSSSTRRSSRRRRRSIPG